MDLLDNHILLSEGSSHGEKWAVYLQIAVLLLLIALATALRIWIPENEGMRYSGMYRPQKIAQDQLFWNYLSIQIALALSVISSGGLFISALNFKMHSKQKTSEKTPDFFWLCQLAFGLASFGLALILIPYWAHGIFHAYYESPRVRDFSTFYLVSPNWISSIRQTLALIFILLSPIFLPYFAIALPFAYRRQKTEHPDLKTFHLLWISFSSLLVVALILFWWAKVILWLMD